MCGIVAIASKEEFNTSIIVEGLRKLEYRGYDSSGIAYPFQDQLCISKAAGKISSLQYHSDLCKVGLGHTRWATHGKPSLENAHPHIDSTGRIALVHNGIIENHLVLKERLPHSTFFSETDSEVLVQWIASFYKGDLLSAVQEALADVHGAYGIAVIALDQPNLLVGARKGSPLVLGVGHERCYLASDVTPIIKHTKDVVYLDDGDLVSIEYGKYQIHSSQNQKVVREVEHIDLVEDEIAKKGFPHFMLKEIFEQPESIQTSMRGRLLIPEGTAKLSGLEENIKDLKDLDRILLVACGTSYYASMVGEYLIEDLAGVPVEVEYASEFRYRNPIITSKTVVIVLSQSGETADTLSALAEAKRKGAVVLGICNSVGSSIARATDGGVYLHIGPEIGVASTKAFTAQVTVLSLIALHLGRMRRISNTAGSMLAQELASVPTKVKEILELSESIYKIAEKFADVEHFFYLGRNFNYPVALEGALKLKEISYIHAEGYPAAELKHGPIALIDEKMPVLVIAAEDVLHDKLLSNVKEIKARGGKVIAVLPQGEKEIAAEADETIFIPKIHPAFSPLLTVIPLQLFAYHMAVLRKNDVDQPRNLAKSVTVE